MDEAVKDINKAAQNISENAGPAVVTKNESQVSEEEKTSDAITANTENATEEQEPQVKIDEEK